MIKRLKESLPRIARFFLYLWLGAIGLFAACVIIGARQPNQVYPTPLSDFLLVDVIVGVGSFTFMCIFALLGSAFNPKERKVGLTTQDTKQKGKTSNDMKLVLYVLVVLSGLSLFFYGRLTGTEKGILIGEENIKRQVSTPSPTPNLTPTPTSINKPAPVYRKSSFDGPQLWEAVNQRRVEHGVGTLERNDSLCSIASFRLNELLTLGKLDNHDGFNALWQNPNSQYAWIFNQYQIWEYILYNSGGTALDAVNQWDNTMGHQTLLRGGQFRWGCTYAQNGFGVAIVGFK